MKGYERFFTPAKAFGMNALAAFVLSGVIAKTFGWIGWSPSRYFTSNEFTSLVYAILFVLVIFRCQEARNKTLQTPVPVGFGRLGIRPIIS